MRPARLSRRWRTTPRRTCEPPRPAAPSGSPRPSVSDADVFRYSTQPGPVHEMPRKREERSDSAFRTLTREQQRGWLAYMRVQLRLTYEMNRELQADGNLSLPDYDVLNALRYARGGRMRITALAAQIGWERSRLSHHVRRLQNRGLVESRQAPADRRASEIAITDQGWDEITNASSGHIDLVRRLFFDGLPDELIEPLTVGLERVYDNILDRGTLPAPADEP